MVLMSLMPCLAGYSVLSTHLQRAAHGIAVLPEVMRTEAVCLHTMQR